MQELIESLKAQAFALEQQGLTELAARARSEARRLEQQKKALEQDNGKEQAHGIQESK